MQKADKLLTSETIKRTTLPYFTLDGNICALMGAKDHVNIFIYDPIAPDPEGIINQGQGNSSARAIQVFEGNPNNRAGGWRRLEELSCRNSSIKTRDNRS